MAQANAIRGSEPGRLRALVAARLAVLALGMIVALSACNLNIFSLVDVPNGDAQLLSAARGCFDRGDYQCAANDYSKLSPDLSDTANSEESFAAIAQAGLTISAFMTTFAAPGITIGKGLQGLVSAEMRQAGQTERLLIYNNGFMLWPNIVNGNLKALSEFLTGTSLASEVLAEAATGGVLHQTDIATSPAACIAGGVAGCAVTPGPCDPPPGSALSATIITPAFAQPGATQPTAATAPTGQATWDMVYWSLSGAAGALSSLGTSGLAGQAGQAFQVISGAAAPDTSPLVGNCFRYELLSYGLGI